MAVSFFQLRHAEALLVAEYEESREALNRLQQGHMAPDQGDAIVEKRIKAMRRLRIFFETREIPDDIAGKMGLLPVLHLSNEELERYHLDQVAETRELSSITAHVSSCESCRDRSAAMDRFLSRVRSGKLRIGVDR